MKIIYSGAHPDVYVPEFEDECPVLGNVLKGKPVEVPDHIASRLLEQDTWKAVVPVKPATPTTTNGA